MSSPQILVVSHLNIYNNYHLPIYTLFYLITLSNLYYSLIYYVYMLSLPLLMLVPHYNSKNHLIHNSYSLTYYPVIPIYNPNSLSTPYITDSSRRLYLPYIVYPQTITPIPNYPSHLLINRDYSIYSLLSLFIIFYIIQYINTLNFLSYVF